MTAIFSNFLGDSLQVFVDDVSVFGEDFNKCLAHLTKILEVCIRKRLVLSGEKSHFMIQRGSSAWASRLEQRTGGGCGEDQGHPKPPSIFHIMRFTELPWARWLQPKVYIVRCQSLKAIDHPSLQRQRFHHRQRRGASI